MDNNQIPSYPISLAILDVVPVLLFVAAMLILTKKVQTSIFFVGAAITAVGGIMQVLWKFLIATARKNVPILHSQFPFTMLLGFLLMAVAILVFRKNIDWLLIKEILFHFPCSFFLALIIICFILMIILSFTPCMKDVQSQWLEECVNIVFQGSVLACSLCIVILG